MELCSMVSVSCCAALRYADVDEDESVPVSNLHKSARDTLGSEHWLSMAKAESETFYSSLNLSIEQLASSRFLDAGVGQVTLPSRLRRRNLGPRWIEPSYTFHNDLVQTCGIHSE
jgi:hypothetical protein